ncbi:hypothetical protein K439DRAFT_1352860 [Ramaria rubella]|nr:hypothetical protein K439DRAFT_1352860 [Ramaria rubella]
MKHWGKVRIGDGGDCICTSTTCANHASRDMSYVHMCVDIHAHKHCKEPQFKTQCFYGQLMTILVCDLPSHSLFNHHPEHRLLETCNTAGQDGTLSPVTYTVFLNSGSPTVIELTAISCVVGCIKVGHGNTWGIIDQRCGLVRLAFVDDPELVDEMEDDELGIQHGTLTIFYLVDIHNVKSVLSTRFSV